MIPSKKKQVDNEFEKRFEEQQRQTVEIAAAINGDKPKPFTKKEESGKDTREQITIKLSAGLSKTDLSNWCKLHGLTLNNFLQTCAVYIQNEVNCGHLTISKVGGIHKI